MGVPEGERGDREKDDTRLKTRKSSIAHSLTLVSLVILKSEDTTKKAELSAGEQLWLTTI